MKNFLRIILKIKLLERERLLVNIVVVDFFVGCRRKYVSNKFCVIKRGESVLKKFKIKAGIKVQTLHFHNIQTDWISYQNDFFNL